jgi:hypothetical protein
MLLIFGCVLPELSGAVVVFKIAPWASVLLAAAAVSTVVFIVTQLRRQPCFVRVYSEKIEVATPRHRLVFKREDILECSLIEEKNVVLKHRDEIQVLEVKDGKAFHQAFQRMRA